MGEVITWLGANWMTVVGVVASVVMGASIAVKAIAPFTSTDKDDRAAGWLEKVYKWLNALALNPKQPDPAEPEE